MIGMRHRVAGTFPRDYKFPSDVDFDAFLSDANNEFNKSTFRWPNDVPTHTDDPSAKVVEKILSADVPDSKKNPDEPPRNVDAGKELSVGVSGSKLYSDEPP